MAEQVQSELLSEVTDVDVLRTLLADLHDDVAGKVARFRQLADLSIALGSSGTMMPGGETAFAAWTEARSSFVHGNYVATVLLCQGLAEHILAAYLMLGLDGEKLPDRVAFNDTLNRCLARGVITQGDADDLRRLMNLRNPLTHYRSIDDPSNLSQRILNTRLPAEMHLLNDATFAMSMAIRLLALPAFRLGD
ncbi:hypothetical protein [Caballeronia sp. J97]|uniref:hypothetical protein n=1 Tax=Caballeronia sp. J97 TaxID=2805429 RepID=UPI002AB07501|nr:hypothetical protein [Caballeronia sp. J97]